MRIDKYLKNARLIKRRSLAKEACDHGKISINGKPAKPGSEVSVGDIVVLSLGTKETKIEITELSEHVTKEDAKSLYRLI